jgi:hypothetical protein
MDFMVVLFTALIAVRGGSKMACGYVIKPGTAPCCGNYDSAAPFDESGRRGQHKCWNITICGCPGSEVKAIEHMTKCAQELGAQNATAARANAMARAQAAQDLVDATTKRCPYCAETIQLAAKKCRFCGEML